MPFPTRRFNVPFRPSRGAFPTQVEIFEPTLGFNASQPPWDLKPGETPNSENWISEDGFLTPRSGLSIFGNVTGLADVATLAVEHQNVDGDRFPVIASAQTASAFIGGSWSTLSYVIRGTGAPADALSGNSSQQIFGAGVYNPVIDENWLIFSNFHNTPKTWQPSQTTYSDLSDFISVESFGKIPYSLDNRLCFFGCASSDTTFATRVRWSERGLTSNFSTQGAGFEDLMDMRGVASGVALREFDALLFSTEEVWIQRPRRDIFAFDFAALSRSVSCPYPKTIVKTPLGVIFLSRELEPYLIAGSQLQSVGEKVHNHLRGLLSNPEDAFAIYNSRRQRYELYFRTSGEVERPAHGLWLDMDAGAWYPINLESREMGAAAEVGADLSADILWNSVSMTWDEIETAWDNMVESSSKDKEVMLISSRGTAYRLREDQLTDDGSTITSIWDSHAFRGQDRSRKVSMQQLWLNYDSTSASTVSAHLRSDIGANFDVSSSVRLQSSDGSKGFMPVYITGDSPQFRLVHNQAARPRIASLTAQTKDGGQF